MRKFYSIVLMATALLIGTNAGAQGPTTWAELKTALQAGGKVTLTQDINETATASSWQGCWIGAADIAATAKSAELDLAGHSITITANSNDIAIYPFVITKGELKVVNSSADEAVIDVLVQSTSTAKSTNVFSVYGSYDYNQDPKAANPFTHLEIGTNVKVNTNNGTVIAIDQKVARNPASFATTNYHTDYLYTTNSKGKKSYYGFAFGVRVDVKGTLISQGGYKCYGIKTNGNLAYPGDTKKSVNTADWITADYQAHVADSASIAHAPYIHVYPTAVINSDNKKLSDASAAVYCSGYAQWLVEGTCEGATGLYASAGDIDIANATISSGATEYAAGTEKGHANGCGSAIVINSRDAYGAEGSIDVNISGDTKVESKAGYAVEEVVNANTTNVEAVTIEGGTFEGGAQGAIAISEQTGTNTDSKVTVFGGNVEGEVKVGGTTDGLSAITSADTHVTEVVVDGKTTYVVSQGEAPTGYATVADHAGKSVKWNGASETLSADLELAELEINEASAQVLTIAEGATLTVGRVVLGANAQIIVNAGAKFIVTGTQGIVAPVVDNIVLKNEEGNPSIFLFNPGVTSNRHPNATVEFVSRSYTISASDYAFQRFGIPTMAGKLTEITTKYNNADVATGFMNYDYAADDWASIGYLNYSGTPLDITKLANPFEYYQMQHNAPAMGTIVTMKGELVGNEIPSVNVREGVFNGYANSCTALMSMRNVISTSSQAIYLNNIQAHQKVWISYTMLDLLSGDKYIYPLQPFLINNDKAATTLSIDYADAVYYTPVGSGEAKPAGAPARNRSINEVATFVKLIVNGENTYDRVLLAEGADFTEEFDHMYDAVKYMNDGLNMYVSANEKMSNFATNDLNNTFVGLQTVNGGNYTIEIADVQGEELTLIDHETGARVAMVEGATYEFNADANTVNDYRFEIVGRQNMPTAIDNTEAVKSVKGVYTITGQYVGEMNVWNTLPAGVYVVNGEKRVK